MATGGATIVVGIVVEETGVGIVEEEEAAVVVDAELFDGRAELALAAHRPALDAQAVVSVLEYVVDVPLADVRGCVEDARVAYVLIVLPDLDVVALERLLVVVGRDALPLDGELVHLALVGEQHLAIARPLALIDLDVLGRRLRRHAERAVAEELRLDTLAGRVEHVDAHEVDGVRLEADDDGRRALAEKALAPIVGVLVEVVAPVAHHVAEQFALQHGKVVLRYRIPCHQNGRRVERLAAHV